MINHEDPFFAAAALAMRFCTSSFDRILTASFEKT